MLQAMSSTVIQELPPEFLEVSIMWAPNSWMVGKMDRTSYRDNDQHGSFKDSQQLQVPMILPYSLLLGYGYLQLQIEYHGYLIGYHTHKPMISIFCNPFTCEKKHDFLDTHPAPLFCTERRLRGVARSGANCWTASCRLIPWGKDSPKKCGKSMVSLGTMIWKWRLFHIFLFVWRVNQGKWWFNQKPYAARWRFKHENWVKSC